MKLKKFNFIAKLLILFAGICTYSCSFADEPFMLVSEEEYLLQLKQKNMINKGVEFNSNSTYWTNQNAPVITINSPNITSVLYSPIQIDIKFKAIDNAKIKPDSLRVFYGWLNLDITDRIKAHARISNSGITAENIKLPVGEHNITIEIMDTKDRNSEKQVSFEILKPENR